MSYWDTEDRAPRLQQQQKPTPHGKRSAWCRCSHHYSGHGLYADVPGCAMCRCQQFTRMGWVARRLYGRFMNGSAKDPAPLRSGVAGVPGGGSSGEG